MLILLLPITLVAVFRPQLCTEAHPTDDLVISWRKVIAGIATAQGNDVLILRKWGYRSNPSYEGFRIRQREILITKRAVL